VIAVLLECGVSEEDGSEVVEALKVFGEQRWSSVLLLFPSISIKGLRLFTFSGLILFKFCIEMLCSFCGFVKGESSADGGANCQKVKKGDVKGRLRFCTNDFHTHHTRRTTLQPGRPSFVSTYWFGESHSKPKKLPMASL
jgi:hypothetical protein